MGVPGLVSVVALTIAMFMLGIDVLRRTVSVQAHVGVIFLVMAPVCAMSAAFFTTTQRWPALLGLAVGAITARLGEPEPDSGTARQAQCEAKSEIVPVQPPHGRPLVAAMW